MNVLVNLLLSFRIRFSLLYFPFITLFNPILRIFSILCQMIINRSLCRSYFRHILLLRKWNSFSLNYYFFKLTLIWVEEFLLFTDDLVQWIVNNYRILRLNWLSWLSLLETLYQANLRSKRRDLIDKFSVEILIFGLINIVSIMFWWFLLNWIVFVLNLCLSFKV